MIPDMKLLLNRLKAERTEHSEDTTVMEVHECQKAMDRAAAKIGMLRITHHDLRHLFATRCIESGAAGAFKELYRGVSVASMPANIPGSGFSEIMDGSCECQAK